MFLRAKDGFYAGQIREYSPEAGRALLAAGRAENPYSDGDTVAGADVRVGEDVADCVVPRKVAEKMTRAMRRKATHGRD